MRKVRHYLLVLWYWIANIGPWYVVGQWVDDDGVIRRFRTATEHTFRGREVAGAYADVRNDSAVTDPLGTVYYVWHKIEWNHHLKGAL